MAYDWNIDWNSVDGADLLNKEVVDLFAEAVFERAQLASAADPLTEIDTENYYLQETYTLADLAVLRRELFGLQYGLRWIDPQADPSGAISMPQLQILRGRPIFRVTTYDYGGPAQVIIHSIEDLSDDYPAFPEGGTMRKVPREIYDLAQSGEDGQVARFTACINRTWRSALSTDPLFGKVANTPFDQRQLSRGKYKRQDGTWVPIEDTESPDVLSETFPGQQIFPFSHFFGDYFGGHWLNDTRDLINQATRRVAECSRCRRHFFVGGDEIYETVEGFAVVRESGGDAIQVDIQVPDGRSWMVEFWVNPLSADPPVVESQGNSYRFYTQWTKLGEMLISSRGRYTHPIPGDMEVMEMPGDVKGVLLSPLVAVIIRGDVDGGLKYQA